MENHWDIGLCSCTKNCKVCIYSFLVPCGPFFIQPMAYSKMTGEDFKSTCSLLCTLGTYGHAMLRGRIREKYNINGSYINDWFVWFYCCCCAAVQEMTQVNNSIIGKNNNSSNIKQ